MRTHRVSSTRVNNSNKVGDKKQKWGVPGCKPLQTGRSGAGFVLHANDEARARTLSLLQINLQRLAKRVALLAQCELQRQGRRA